MFTMFSATCYIWRFVNHTEDKLRHEKNNIIRLILTLREAVAPSGVPVVVRSRSTPHHFIIRQAVVDYSVFEEKWKTTLSSLSITTMCAKTTTSRTLVAHETSVCYTMASLRPVPTSVILVHAVDDVIICLTVSPFLVSVVVACCSTPR